MAAFSLRVSRDAASSTLRSRSRSSDSASSALRASTSAEEAGLEAPFSLGSPLGAGSEGAWAPLVVSGSRRFLSLPRRPVPKPVSASTWGVSLTVSSLTASRSARGAWG